MNTLRQPHKYVHSSIVIGQKHPQKNKPIHKNKKTKPINKPNQPSAIRLGRINDMFSRLNERGNNFLNDVSTTLPKIKDAMQLRTQYKVLLYALLELLFESQNIHVIHHSLDKANKSSVLPMRFLSNDISFHQYMPNSPSFLEGLPPADENTFVLFPHKESAVVSKQCAVKNLIVIDCTWFQTDQIIQQLHSHKYTQYLRVGNYSTAFWRYNHHNDHALSTAQTIMYFLRETQSLQSQSANIKKYDPLMLLFSLNLAIVVNSAEEGQNVNDIEQQE